MGLEITAICLGALMASALLTGMLRQITLSRGPLDVPNARSSHSTATPRGGGVSMVVSASAAWSVLAMLGMVKASLLVALVGGGTVVAAVGLLDDRQSVPAGIRLAVHLGAAVWALLWIGAPSSLRIGEHLLQLGWFGGLLTVLGIVWTVNLFNFMDGIDGLAASEAAFIGCSGAVLSWLSTGSPDAAAGLTLAAVCIGFLRWNWPPAKIFMGDVGSGYLGYVVGVLIVADARINPTSPWIWLILGGVFFADSTVTLLRRAFRAERLHEAHRSHAYQWLARRWDSHGRVTVAVAMLNIACLLPCALLAMLYPGRAAWLAAGTVAALVSAALAAGAGRREAPNCGPPPER